MRKAKIAIYVVLAGLFAAGFTHAHDPSLHKEKMEKPKCEAIKNIDHSKMDENDPVMLAMMKKCNYLERNYPFQHTYLTQRGSRKKRF